MTIRIQDQKKSITALAEIVAEMHSVYQIAQSLERYCDTYAAFAGNEAISNLQTAERKLSEVNGILSETSQHIEQKVDRVLNGEAIFPQYKVLMIDRRLIGGETQKAYILKAPDGLNISEVYFIPKSMTEPDTNGVDLNYRYFPDFTVSAKAEKVKNSPVRHVPVQYMVHLVEKCNQYLVNSCQKQNLKDDVIRYYSSGSRKIQWEYNMDPEDTYEIPVLGKAMEDLFLAKDENVADIELLACLRINVDEKMTVNEMNQLCRFLSEDCSVKPSAILSLTDEQEDLIRSILDDMRSGRNKIYGRESTKEQARYGFNLDDQEKKIRNYVDVYYESGTYEFEMVREEGASAKNLNRPRMNEVISLVKRKQVDVIVIHNLDRLTRRVKDLATLLELFEEYEVSLQSITEKIDTKTPMGRFFIFLIVLIAQWEQDTISDRTRRGIEESARQGNYALPGAPFGYRRNPEDNHKLIICEEEALIVKRIFESIAYKDYSIKALSNELKGEKVLGKSWSEISLEKIVNNKIYYGTFSRFEEEYENHTVPIIDKNLFELAHARLSGWHIKQRNEYIYKGMVVCGSCGRKMINHYSESKNGRLHFYYRCKKCRVQVSEKSINETFADIFTRMLQDEKYRIDLENMKTVHSDLSDILDIIPKDMLRYNTDLDYVSHLYAKKQVMIDDLEKCIEKISAGQKNTSFMQLPYSEKRSFINNTIDNIVFDVKSNSLDVHYLKN